MTQNFALGFSFTLSCIQARPDRKDLSIINKLNRLVALIESWFNWDWLSSYGAKGHHNGPRARTRTGSSSFFKPKGLRAAVQSKRANTTMSWLILFWLGKCLSVQNRCTDQRLKAKIPTITSWSNWPLDQNWKDTWRWTSWQSRVSKIKLSYEKAMHV